MKKCELCSSPAKLFCESDQADLCWVCDSKVHSANLLVTKHSRILLCHVCQSLTPWRGSGPKFVPTMSVCEDCARTKNEGLRQQNDHDGGGHGGGEDEDENDDDGEEEEEIREEEEDEDDDDDEENQVVPWKCTPPPPVSSS
ncbi:zinc finger protein CONSTANS-LIKE 4-like [Prosopis cineraria]|uniref:zinc finger protein CONSTANS-LIKE 4-like n=1 Tax=Prosopis cineraria TaxID=364024 RepID=UPI002410A995|nr:zinc finger protein CONSTANS-LIKE 4-like [Prosopis cineraria]